MAASHSMMRRLQMENCSAGKRPLKRSLHTATAHCTLHTATAHCHCTLPLHNSLVAAPYAGCQHDMRVNSYMRVNDTLLLHTSLNAAL